MTGLGNFDTFFGFEKARLCEPYCSSRRSNFFSIHIFDTKNEHVTFSIFDVICANKNSFARTEEKNRRMMAKRFQQKVIEDARKAGSPFPSGHRQRDLFLSGMS